MITNHRSRIVLIALFLALSAGAAWWWQRDAESNPLENWCSDQLRRIAEDLLEPAFEFTSIEMELPAAVTLHDVSFTTDDVAIIRIDLLRLEFRDLPRRGQPLVIEAATFARPEVRLIGRDDGDLVGFADFVKSTDGRQFEDGGSSRPSDFIAIRRITIRDGMLEWAPSGSEQPLRLEQLQMDLATAPDGDNPGRYGFEADIERAPVISLQWDGGINIDTGDLEFNDTVLQVDLSRDEYSSLTPSIQDLLRRYAIVGDLRLQATGVVPLADADATDLAFNASLRQASAAFGGYQVPIDSAELTASFRQMRLAWDPLSVQAFGGRIESTGMNDFAGAGAFASDVDADGIQLENMLSPVEGESARYSGKIDLDLSVEGERASARPTMKGTGTVAIENARLINVPVVTALASALQARADADTGRDRGELEFTIGSDRTTIDRSEIRSVSMAVRATGDLHYDGELDLMVNAGVLEKAQSLLGGLGDALGALTDRLLPYRVSGTWSAPIVAPSPLGFSLGKDRRGGE